MKIHELFSKPIDRPIEGVIKADDDRHLQTEVEEYVVTAEVTRSLSNFVECYLNEPSANGVWISGFFGSGKSHLLKMLSLLLENQALPNGGPTPSAVILPKIDDQILRGDLQRAVKIPARSVLFNIDQKSDSIGGDQVSAVLEVFVKVMNELQGYYAQQGHIAQFEYELDTRGQLADFKAAYARISKRTWDTDLPVLDTLENETFAQVYAEHFGKSYDEGMLYFDRMRANYKVSIESFAKRVKDYIQKQPAGFRLNFFVDEAGQFIGQNSKLMLNLQTIAETLSTVCQGRAWVFVTSQGDLQRVIGELTSGTGQDFSKIQGRFKTRLTLTSADVREVIQKRLLAKRDAEPEVLTAIYDAEKENLQTLFRFGDGSTEYKRWRGSDEFCAYYPFVPYQFDLFQRAIERLSDHGAFTGRYTAKGERSMLAVFQDVVKSLGAMDVGRLASFDMMFDGISATLRGDLQTSLRQAERQLSNPLAVRVLKALFLLKWVREFKPTPRNVAILLIDRPHIDIQQHEKDVREALNLLESQSYLQRNGDTYEFLTDVEKDIEVEIKTTEIDEGQVSRKLADIFFADVLRDPKIRFEGNGVDYAYARKLDDQLINKDADIAVNILTTNYEHYDQPAVLASRNMGQSEIAVVLPADIRVIDECRLFLKTEKYIQQNTGASVDETRKAILTQRGQQNSARRSTLQASATELLSKARFYVNGSVLLIPEGDARNRFGRAGQELITFAYAKLKMLKGAYDEALLSKVLLQPDDLMGSGGMTLSEAEQEALTYVQRRQKNGERINVEEIVRDFGRKPYGWPGLAVATQVARLFRMGKIELREGDLLSPSAAMTLLKNPRQHSGVWVRLQEQFDGAKVAALKRFHVELFDRANDATDPRGVAQQTAAALAAEARELETLLEQASRYPFLKQLQPLAEHMKRLAEKEYSHLLNQLGEFRDDLLTAKEDVLAPIKAFMHGAQRHTYDDVIRFYREETANFAELGAGDLAAVKALADSAAPFRGNGVPLAKAAMGKLREQIDKQLVIERQAGANVLEAIEARLRALPEFAGLSEAQQTQVLQHTHSARQEIASARFITAIRDRLSRANSQDFPAQMTLAHSLATPPAPPAATQVITGNSSQTQGAHTLHGTGAVISYVAASSLKVDCGLPYVANEAELEQWLAALRAAALAEINQGKRITL